MALKNVPKGGPLTLTLKAQAAKTERGPRFVKFYASDNAYFSICGAGEAAIGIVDGIFSAGETVTIQLPPALALIQFGGTVAVGDKVASDANGKAITATFGVQVNGTAFVGGADGEVGTIKTFEAIEEAAVGGQIVDFGTTTLVAGTKTISNTKVAAGDKILVTPYTLGGTPGTLSVGTIVAATSFIVQSSSNTDTSVVAWVIVR